MAGSCVELSDRFLAEDFEAIRQLVTIVSDNQLSEVTVTLRDGVNVTVKAEEPELSAPASYSARSTVSVDQIPSHSPSTGFDLKPPARRGVAVVSPMMGIFYESPSPGEPAFVKLGDEVRVGQTIGLIEAMKVFSEVPSEMAGLVVEITARSGELVHVGDPLMYLESV
jgi:acetyl-CoA carboxylase biotin carboxyl carrier protein